MGKQDKDTRNKNADDWMRQHEFPTTVLKNDNRAAYEAADDWCEVAMGGPPPPTSFAQAMPEPFKAESNKRQRARLLTRVLSDRFNLALYD